MNIDDKNIKELLELTKENNAMLRYIVDCIDNAKLQADSENANDFIRNILANLISNKVDGNIKNGGII